MKKTFLTAAIISLSIISHGQIFLQAGAGYSLKAKSPTVELMAGGIFRDQLVISGGLQTHTQNVKTNACLFQGRLGFQIHASEYTRIIPYVGVSQFYKSSDNKELNITRPLFALEVNQELNAPGASVYLGSSLSGSLVIVSAGMRFSFLRD